MKKVILIIGFVCSVSHLYSQIPGYEVSFNHIFDNREYFSEYGFPQTIFGARLDASLCFDIDSTQGFVAGFNYMYEYGSTIKGVAPQLNLYYHYESSHLDMAFGSFPRLNRIEFSKSFLNDTLLYYRPNVEGAYLAYSGKLGKLSGFIDWTSRVSDTRRETFLIGLNAKLYAQNFFIEPTFLMYHNARSKNTLDTIPLQDNGIMSALIGYQLKQKEKDISFKVSTGFIASYNRFRPSDFSWGRGIMTNFDFQYNIFGFAGVYYIGTPLIFAYGDPFYKAGNYGRIDIFIVPLKSSKLSSRVGWSLHFIPGEGIHNSQQVLLSVMF